MKNGCEIKDVVETCEACQFCAITKNKQIELPVNVGDMVYFIEFPTNASVKNKELPTVKSAEVYKVEYSSERGYERMRIDYQYHNKLGDYSTDWQMWKDGILYTSLEEANKKLQEILQTTDY